MVQRAPSGYVLDPADPRAPTDEQWEAMTPEERARVVGMLPSEPDVEFLPPPEGDDHWEAGAAARQTLQSFFRGTARKIYISGNMAVFYPGERLFAPDLIVVLDVEPGKRDSWVVQNEGKGLDLALEVHVKGERRKDVVTNVERFARLGIQEYFVFDRGRLGLTGYRLASPAGKKRRAYQPIVPQGGRFASHVLGLDLMVEGTALRFYSATAPLLDAEERIARISTVFDEALRRAEAAEEKVRALEEEIARLKREH
jgi:Uma2 family endonuclease